MPTLNSISSRTKFFLSWVLTVAVLCAIRVSTADPLGPTRQVDWEPTASALASETGLRRGFVGTVGSSSARIFHGLPLGSKTTDGVHCFNGVGVEWCDDYGIGNPVSTAQLPLVTSAARGAVPEIAASNDVLVSSDGSAASWGKVTNAMLAGSVDWSKLTGYPTITTTSPLTIGSGSSADLSTSRTIAINTVSNANTGIIGQTIPYSGVVLASTNGTSAVWSSTPVLTGLSLGGTPATAGTLRLGFGSTINARNEADSGNLSLLYLDTGNVLTLGSTSTGIKIGGTTFPATPSSGDIGKLLYVSAANTYAAGSPQNSIKRP